MIATHNVKINGKWIRTGEEIPGNKAPEAAKVKPEAKPAEEKKPAAVRTPRRKKAAV